MSHVAASFLAAASAGCGSSTLPAPRITAVSPPIGWTDLGETIDVTGESFGSGIVPDAGDPDASSVERAMVELVSEEGDVLLLVGSYLGPTLLRVTLAPDSVLPSRYDVRVLNPDGSDDVEPLALWMRGPPVAVRFEAIGSVMVSNSASTSVQATLLDSGDNPTPLRTGETFSVDLTSDSATAVLGASTLAIGATGSAGTFTVRNTVAEIVRVELDPADLAALGIAMSGSNASIQFTPAPTVRVVIPDATELLQTDNFAMTEVRLEDSFGNLSPRTASYVVQIDAGSGTCINWRIMQGPTESFVVTIPAGEAAAPITVFCDDGGQDAIVTVIIQDAGALPPLNVSTVSVIDLTTPL